MDVNEQETPMDLDEEEIPNIPTSVPEASPSLLISDEKTSTNPPPTLLQPPLLVPTPTLTPTLQLQPPLIQQTLVVPPPLSTPILPPISPIPFIPPHLRPLAPIPPHPPTIRPPQPQQNAELNASDFGSDHEESSPNRSMDYEISEESKQAKERQEKAIQHLLMKRRAFALAVPTNDSVVRARLRRLGDHPITLFGEREMERRDRLRLIMVKLDADGQLDKLLKAAHEDEEAATTDAAEEESGGEGPQQYPFYTEGSNELLKARIDIAKYSMVRASLKLERARRRRDDPDEDLDAEMGWALKQAGSLNLRCSEIGDDRPLTGCSFSHDGKFLATCAMSGATKLWSMPQVNKVAHLKGHMERATDVSFSPVQNFLATASADQTAILWNIKGSSLRKFEGHLDSLARVAFHPSGKYLGTASFDKTWRLWDIETGVELLLQEGHSRSVYGICFHKDGSLAASCGLDALARVWDLRTGRSVLALEGHVKPIFGISFSPNGYHLATGSGDNTCRIWDLRKKKSLYVIPAHSKLISQVKFEPQEGYFLVTASYDRTTKVWSARDFKPIRTLSDESRVASLDILEDGQYIATVSHDRTIKLWSSGSNEKEKAMDIY